MNGTWGWILFGVICVAAVALLVTFIVLTIKKKWFAQIKDTLEVAIREAEEKYPSESDKKFGKEKQEYVLAKVQEKCSELNITYGFIYKMLIVAIKTIISNYNILTK